MWSCSWFRGPASPTSHRRTRRTRTAIDYQGRTVHRRFSCRSDNLLNLQSLRCAVRTPELYTNGVSIQHDIEAGRRGRRNSVAPPALHWTRQWPTTLRGPRRSKAASRRSGTARTARPSILDNERLTPRGRPREFTAKHSDNPGSPDNYDIVRYDLWRTAMEAGDP
jgi:hypothetical protein